MTYGFGSPGGRGGRGGFLTCTLWFSDGSTSGTVGVCTEGSGDTRGVVTCALTSNSYCGIASKPSTKLRVPNGCTRRRSSSMTESAGLNGRGESCGRFFFRRFGGKVPFGIRCVVVCLCHGAYLSLVTRPARLPSLGDARHVHGSRPLDPANEESAVFSLPGLHIPTRGSCTTVAALRCSAGGVGLSTDPSMDTCKGIFRMVPRIRKPGDVKEQYQHVRQFPDGSKSFSVS